MISPAIHLWLPLLLAALGWPAAAAAQTTPAFQIIGKLDDGVVRLRLRRGGRFDLTVVVRGAPGAGYGLRFSRRRVFFVKLRDGKPSRIGGFEHLSGLGGRRFVEVLIFASGDQLVAALYDRRLEKPWATLALGGVRPAKGKVGLLLGPGDRGTRLVRSSVRRLGAQAPRFGRRAPRLYVTVPRQAASKVGTSGFALKTLGRIVEQTGADVVLETDLARLEALLALRLQIRSINAHRPWKYIVSGYKGPAMVGRQLQAWQRRHPQAARLEVLARSHLGRPVHALCIADRIKPNDPRPSVLLVGGHHGTEPLSVEFVLDAIEQLLARGAPPRLARFRRKVVVCAVPLLNPDGLHRYLDRSLRSGRKNGRDHNGDGIVDPREGVDLNRNYPFRWDAATTRRDITSPFSKYYRGAKAASEPEVLGMMRLAAREHFVASISYHTGSVAMHVPYTVAGARSPQPDVASQVAAELVQRIGVHPEVSRRLRIVRNIPSVAGTDQDYYLHAFGTVALLVEGARRTPRRRRQRDAIVAALRPGWTGLLDRVLTGPAVWGLVRDGRGRPVQATVGVTEVKLLEGERWRSRPRDGRFDRLLPGPGRYHLQVEASGYRPREQVVVVGRRDRKRLDFVLRR